MRSRPSASRCLTLALACLGAIGAPDAAEGQCELAKLLASDGSAEDVLGYSVAVSGDMAIVGAPGDDARGSGSGAAYVYRYDLGMARWVEETKLVPDDGAMSDRFGIAVAMEGDLAVIGADQDDDHCPACGAAYVYRFNGTTWTQEVKLLPSGEADHFGDTIAIDADRVIIGAATGLVRENYPSYVFRFLDGEWIEEAQLLPSDGVVGTNFGTAVAIDGDVAIVSAILDDANGMHSGAAYVFRLVHSEWTDDGKLLASDGEAGDLFGQSLAVRGDTVIVGAPSDAFGRGSAYRFRYVGSAWLEEEKLEPSDGNQSAQFGYSMSLDDDIVVFGAYASRGPSGRPGAAYLFAEEGGGWAERVKLLASDGQHADFFGFSVGLDGDTIVVGAHLRHELVPYMGAAYVFDVRPCVQLLRSR